MNAWGDCFQETGDSFTNQSLRWKGSVPHLREMEIAGAIVQRFSVSCCKPMMCVYRAAVFTDTSNILVEEICLWRGYFFIPLDRRGEHIESWLWLLKRALELNKWPCSYTLPLDWLHDQSVFQGWFQTKMISALRVWRWRVISPSLVSSPSASLKKVHC